MTSSSSSSSSSEKTKLDYACHLLTELKDQFVATNNNMTTTSTTSYLKKMIPKPLAKKDDNQFIDHRPMNRVEQFRREDNKMAADLDENKLLAGASPEQIRARAIFNAHQTFQQAQQVFQQHQPAQSSPQCHQCGKLFSRKDAVVRHSRIHTGLRPYICGECGTAFTRKHHLERHIRSHAGIKSFICGLCGLSFARKESLMEHCVIHH